MPLPKLPTRLGTLIASSNDAEIDIDADIESDTFVITAPFTAVPQARQATAPATSRVKTAIEPAVPPITLLKPKKKTRLPVARRKLFVLDTNVLLHDSNSLFKFEEHDIFLPMIVLEELDHQKKGMSEVARNARQVSCQIDGMV